MMAFSQFQRCLRPTPPTPPDHWSAPAPPLPLQSPPHRQHPTRNCLSSGHADSVQLRITGTTRETLTEPEQVRPGEESGTASKYLFLDIDVDSYGVEYVNNLRRIELEPGLSPYYVRFFQQDYLDRLREISGKEGLDYKDIPLDDKATYAMLATGDTEGLPGFGYSGMEEVFREALKEVRLSRFSQLVA